MSAIEIILFAFLMYAMGYLLYSRYLSKKVFSLDDSRKTPAWELRDDVDYVPTNRWILLGHHFTSITGAGPIIGPAIAVIWGWLPALLWVVLGAVFIGAVHDFSALVTSIRHKGKSIGTILGNYAGEKARIVFLLLILALAILVNAVFAYVIALLFTKFPASVIPAWSIVPLAVIFGYSVYRFRVNFVLLSIVFLLLLYISVFVGNSFPVYPDILKNLTGIDPLIFWIFILFLYTFFASSLPVWVLLQPRDFLNGLQLIVLLVLMYVGALVADPVVSAPAINIDPEGAPSIFPFLFITIACGALSGFHALVSSGTTSKQLSKESDARTVGYLGFLGESSLAVIVIVACTAGLSLVSYDRYSELYSSWDSIKKSSIPAVVEGGAGLISSLGIDYGLSQTLIATLIVLFAATTMDTSVRIQRYILNELGHIYDLKLLRNPWSASLIAVLTSMVLVFSKEEGKGGFLFWPIFGAANQLLAALALLVSFLYLRSERKPTLAILIPFMLVLIITSSAMFLNFLNNTLKKDILLATVSFIILTLEVVIILESIRVVKNGYK